MRIELRKVETLPGGGLQNTFFDFVGQSPINLWQQPGEEYGNLTTVSPASTLSWSLARLTSRSSKTFLSTSVSRSPSRRASLLTKVVSVLQRALERI